MDEQSFVLVERRVRRLVADLLGVSSRELRFEVSLVDDLAADSLDFVEIGLSLEEELAIMVPEDMLGQVRTYGDVLALARALVGERQRALRAGLPVRTRVIAPGRAPDVTLERAGPLTPYTAQNIAEDALRAGRGARLEVIVPARTEDAGVAAVEAEFAWLGRRDIAVEVRRGNVGGAERAVLGQR